MTARRAATTGLVLLVALSCVARAQRAKRPGLDEILDQLDANLKHYDAAIPSFFCDEHVVSEMTPGQRRDNTVTDSVFRLKRISNPDHTATLAESREVRSVDGQPATAGQRLDGPTVLSGVFEGGLAVVSQAQTACMDYTLERTNPKHPEEPYVVRFATHLTPRNTAACLLQEKSKGSVRIDPASMQITHLELETPRHAINGAGMGSRLITVDYAPVELVGERFWLPAAITSRIVSNPGSFHETVWTFRATYRNYHKLEVTSRIVPSSEVQAR